MVGVKKQHAQTYYYADHSLKSDANNDQNKKSIRSRNKYI